MSDRERLVALARSRFSFLERDRGFRTQVDDRAQRTVLAYVGEPATFEVELDWREQAVFLLVCRTIDGRRPPGYYVHEGRVVRTHLAQALDTGAQRGRQMAAELRKATRRSGTAAMESQIAAAATALHDSLDDLLADFDRILP